MQYEYVAQGLFSTELSYWHRAWSVPGPNGSSGNYYHVGWESPRLWRVVSMGISNGIGENIPCVQTAPLLNSDALLQVLILSSAAS